MPMIVKSMSDFAAELIERVDHEFDSVMIVESGAIKGLGKTSWSILLGQEICRQRGLNYSLEKSIVFDPTSEKIIDSVKNLPACYPIHVDEAGKVLFKLNFAKDYQKDLVIFLNVCRRYGKIIPLNHPSFWGLDRNVQEIADYRITILKRGIAIVRGKSKNPESKDKWMKDETEKAMKERVRNYMDIDAMINALRETPNYLFEIHYNPVDTETYAKYKEMSKALELESFYKNHQNKYKIGLEAVLTIFNEENTKHRFPYHYGELVRAMNKAVQFKTGSMAGGFTRSMIRDIIQNDEDNGLKDFIYKDIKISRTYKPDQDFNDDEADSLVSAPVVKECGAIVDPLFLKIKNTNGS